MPALFAVLILLLSLATVVWLASLRLRDAGIADVFWGPGFAIAAWAFVALGGTASPRGVLVPALVTVWGLRLAIHILARGWGRGEDPRYAAMRRAHGRRFWWVSLFTVFWLQGVILWVVALPLHAVQRPGAPTALGPLDLLGLACVAVGFAFEAVGDRQLARFRSDAANAGKVLDTGLWRYTRHPNYFGDALLWWGFFWFAAALGAWWTAVSPVLMTFLLLRVSGVTLLERGLAETRPSYRDYVRRTSAFVPWRPKRP